MLLIPRASSVCLAAGLMLACSANSPADEDGGSGTSGGKGSSAGSGGVSTASGGSATATGGSGTASGGTSGAGSPGAGSSSGGAAPSGGAAGSGNGSGGSIVVSCPEGGAGGGASDEDTDSPLGLVPGTWQDITPEALDMTDTFGANSVDLDPSHPLTFYASVDQRGIWKTVNGGKDWVRLGDPEQMGTDTTKYIDSPLRVAVDPCNSLHLYATQGVRGSTQGFWVSEDGGESWARPQGFIDIAKTTTNDVTTLAVDPGNFGHVLVGSHSWWSGKSNGGVLESKDGGQTWIAHEPGPTFPGGSIALDFLYDPSTGTGDANTWMINGDGGGILRTTDAGENWTKVSDAGGTHGGAELHRDSAGNLYLPGYQYPSRSTDNGLTWTLLNNGLGYGWYLSVVSDGTNLYTSTSCACGGSPGNAPFWTSPVSDGVTWTEYQGGAQKFGNGPYRSRFEKVNHIIYTANWGVGIWALRVIDP